MMKPNKYGEQLKKAKKKATLPAHLLALEEVKEAEVKVISMFFLSLRFLDVVILFPVLISDNRPEDTKRQRISSDSSSSPSDSKTLHPNAESDEEADQSLKIAGGGHKMIRGAATRNNRDKEIRDREEKRERERADAAGRRKGRAERRRVDGISSNCFFQSQALTSFPDRV